MEIIRIGFLLLVLYYTTRLMYILGYHVTVYNHTPGPCHPIPGVEHGAGDMETLPNGLTFITAGHKWSIGSSHFEMLYRAQGRKGRILLFDFNTPEKGVTELKLDKRFDQSTFHPQGISVIQNEETGKITLFVVSHAPNEDRIEKFVFIKEKMILEHEKSYIDEAINLATDVAATDENSFYFTNFCYSRSPFLFLFETIILQLRLGNVMYFDGTHYAVARDGLILPNGILLSKDKKYVYVANEISTSLSIFQRGTGDHLEILQEFQLHCGPDNFSIEPKSGNLVFGSQPVLLKTAAHLDNPYLHRAPTKVLMIHMKNDSLADGITELYSDEGNNISGGTVASIYDNKMLIGSVVGKLLYCEVLTL